jgi:hypothetical protein
MTYEVATVHCGGKGPILPLSPGMEISHVDNMDNKFSPCMCYQALLNACKKDIIMYVHDDVEIFDSTWVDKIMGIMGSPAVVAVGLGGATSLGNKDLYRKPYDISNMARGGYGSNQRDAEIHGERVKKRRLVVVLDAFFMAVKAEWLRSIDGWPVENLTHHCLDLWLACEAAGGGHETWTVPVDCMHYGGGTSTKPAYAEAKWLKGGTLESDHQEPHKWLYENYRDVLPISIGGGK